MTFPEFSAAVRREVAADAGASEIPYAVNDAGTKYERGALTIYVGPQGSAAIVTHVSRPTDLFGHRSQASMPYPMTPQGAADAATLIGNWLADQYLYR